MLEPDCLTIYLEEENQELVDGERPSSCQDTLYRVTALG